MATHRIFIGKEDIEMRQIGMRSAYSFVNGEFTVYKDKKLVWKQCAKDGDSFVVLCYNGKVIVKNLIPPRRKGDLIAWLIGFNKHNRAHTEEEFEEILEEYRRRYEWEDYLEWELRGENYLFMRCNRAYEEGYHNLVSLIGDSISKEEVLQLVPMMEFPSAYMIKLLSESWGISHQEFNNAKLKGVMKPL